MPSRSPLRRRQGRGGPGRPYGTSPHRASSSGGHLGIIYVPSPSRVKTVSVRIAESFPPCHQSERSFLLEGRPGDGVRCLAHARGHGSSVRLHSEVQTVRFRELATRKKTRG